MQKSIRLMARDSADKYPAAWLAFQKSGEFLLKKVKSREVDPAPLLEQAVADLEHAASIQPERAQVQDSLGVALSMSGKPEAARRHMEIATELEPTNPIFLWNLAALYDELDEGERAVESYRSYLNAAPGVPLAHFHLARALTRLNRFNEALSALELAIESGEEQIHNEPRFGELLRRAKQSRTQVRAQIAARLAPPKENAMGSRWNVLLITVDTLRPDYLSWNGSQRATSPNIDALLAQGVYFDKAVTPVPRTTPALASLMTGAYPQTTGVRTLSDSLPEHLVALPEVFKRDGYQTIAVVTNMMLAYVRGFEAGFDVYDAAFDVRDALQTTESALGHFERAERRKPLFAWVHYIDPHVPYHPRSEIAEDFDPRYEGRFRLSFGRQPKTGEPLDLFREFPDGLIKSQVTHRNDLTDAENAHIRNLYAGDIKMVDVQIGRLVEAVRERFPKTVIVFAADHGESLGEHDFYFDHGDYVYNATSRVPLAFILPREHPWQSTGRRDGWVSLVDVAPTLLDIVGLTAPPDMQVLFEGRSLAPAIREESISSAPVFVESGTAFFPELVKRRRRNDISGRFRAVTVDDWKLIWTPFAPEAEAFELFDLTSDPMEVTNLFHPEHPQVARLRQHLDEWLGAASSSEAQTRTLSEQDREALEKLGYIE